MVGGVKLLGRNGLRSLLLLALPFRLSLFASQLQIEDWPIYRLRICTIGATHPRRSRSAQRGIGGRATGPFLELFHQRLREKWIERERERE